MASASAHSPRYTQVPLPATRFLPGAADPGVRPAEYRVLSAGWGADPARWRESEDYLYGCDLFNAGFWWEAHEALEVVWKQLRATDHAGEAKGVQAMIQVAAACIKRAIGDSAGVERLLTRARANLTAAVQLQAERSMGIDLSAWVEQAETDLRGPGARWPRILLA